MLEGFQEERMSWSVLKRSLGQQRRESTVEEHVLCGCVKCQNVFPLLGRAAPRLVL